MSPRRQPISPAGGDERSPVNRYDADAKGHRVIGSPEMRVLGLASAVLLAVTVPIAAHANGPRSNMGPTNPGPAPGIVRAWDGGSSGGHSGSIGGQPTGGHIRQWNGQWLPPHWGPSGYYGGWGTPGAWSGPYTVWVGPSVPYRSYGDWGALWYPYAEWRGPTGGWGNP
jgi:hypothetical protein